MRSSAEEFFQLIHEALLLRVYLVAGNLCKFLQQLLLTRIQILRSEYFDADVLITSSVAPEMRYTLALHAEDSTGLGTGRYRQLHLAVKSRNGNFVAESCLDKGNRYLAEYIVAVTLEELVGLHKGIYIKVAVAAAPAACPAFPADSDAGTVVYTGGNLYLYFSSDPLMA